MCRGAACIIIILKLLLFPNVICVCIAAFSSWNNLVFHWIDEMPKIKLLPSCCLHCCLGCQICRIVFTLTRLSHFRQIRNKFWTFKIYFWFFWKIFQLPISMFKKKKLFWNQICKVANRYIKIVANASVWKYRIKIDQPWLFKVGIIMWKQSYMLFRQRKWRLHFAENAPLWFFCSHSAKWSKHWENQLMTDNFVFVLLCVL